MKTIQLLLLLTIVFAQEPALEAPLGSPVSKYGKLKVQGVQLVSSSGQPVQLRGMSTHGPQWFENCYTYESFSALVNDWKVDVIRLAMYVNEGGYNNNPTYWKERITQMINWGEQLGVYIIVDWHTLTPGDPNDGSYNNKWDFWGYISSAFSAKNHLLYEICNEPNGVSWSQIENYAIPLIDMIRAKDPHTIVIVGTPTWSQDLYAVRPLSFSNIMYTFHFYSSTHQPNDSFRQQAGRLPIFVTEYGTCEASGSFGNGRVDLYQSEQWVNILNGANQGGQKISFVNWSFSQASESCAALNPSSCNNKNWGSTTYSGTWVKEVISRAH